MPFKPGVSGNPQGRPKDEERLLNPKSLKNKKQVGQDELHKMLRKLKPLSNEALGKLGVLLRDDSTTETNKLKAIILILDKYKELVEQLYINDTDADDEADPKDLEPAQVTPLLSLVVPKDE